MPRTSTSRLSPEKLRELVRAGAEAALRELRADIVAIERTFPELALPRRRRQARAAVNRAVKRTRRMSGAKGGLRTDEAVLGRTPEGKNDSHQINERSFSATGEPVRGLRTKPTA